MLYILFFQFCDVAQIGNRHSQEDLAKFDTRPNMEKKKKEILLYFSYLLELIIKIWQSKIIFSKYGKLEPRFSQKNPLYASISYFSG